MQHYRYQWNLQPRPDLRVTVEVAASSACAARRSVDHFLAEHDGGAWRVESVERTGTALRPEASRDRNESRALPVRAVAGLPISLR